MISNSWIFIIVGIYVSTLLESKSSYLSLMINSVWESGSNTGLFSTVSCIPVFNTAEHINIKYPVF